MRKVRWGALMALGVVLVGCSRSANELLPDGRPPGAVTTYKGGVYDSCFKTAAVGDNPLIDNLDTMYPSWLCCDCNPAMPCDGGKPESTSDKGLEGRIGSWKSCGGWGATYCGQATPTLDWLDDNGSRVLHFSVNGAKGQYLPDLAKPTKFQYLGAWVDGTLREAPSAMGSCYQSSQYVSLVNKSCFNADEYAGIWFMARGSGEVALEVVTPESWPIDDGGDATIPGDFFSTKIEIPSTRAGVPPTQLSPNNWQCFSFPWKVFKTGGWGSSKGNINTLTGKRIISLRFASLVTTSPAPRDFEIFVDNLAFIPKPKLDAGTCSTSDDVCGRSAGTGGASAGGAGGTSGGTGGAAGASLGGTGGGAGATAGTGG
ncbi:MAG TPA: hypothetical protein VGJ84_03245 [Polyangiaceae bacterium]